MTESVPRVSVVMPVFNVETYVADAVGSILAQSFIDFELIVIDDGSTDGTCAVVEQVADPRLRVVRMDGDDVARPNRLERQVAFMDADPSVAVCGSWVEVIGRPGLVLRYPATDDAIRARLRFACTFAHPAVVFRRSLIPPGEFAYDLGSVPVEDFELWVRLARFPEVRFANIAEVLVDYRLPGPQRAGYAAYQSGRATELVVGEAQRSGLFAGAEHVNAFRSLVTLDAPSGVAWGAVVAGVERWSTGEGDMQREVHWRWGLLLRRAPMREWGYAVRASRRLGARSVASVMVLIPYGVVRRSAAVERLVPPLKRLLSVVSRRVTPS